MNTGGVVSRTLTVNVFDELAPAPSVAGTMTVVVPSGKSEPDGIEKINVTGPTASVAVAGNVTKAPPGFVASTTMFGAVVTSGVVSRTTTVSVRPRRPVSACVVLASGWADIAWRASSVCKIVPRQRLPLNGKSQRSD